MITSLLIVLVSVAPLILWGLFHSKGINGSHVRRHIAVFFPTPDLRTVGFRELDALVRRQTHQMLQAAGAYIEMYDRDHVIVLRNGKTRVYSRCNLMEYLDLSRYVTRHIDAGFTVDPNQEGQAKMEFSDFRQAIRKANAAY